jgi:hypothetical protein
MEPLEYRTVCVCGHRYPTKTIEGEAVCCPKCRTISPAKSEPLDEHWWAWLSVQPWYRQMMHWPPKYVAETGTASPKVLSSVPRLPPKPVTAAEARKERDGRLAGL